MATARDADIALDAGIDGLAHVCTDAGPGGEAVHELASRAARHGVFVIGAMALTEAITADGGAELWRDERIWPYLSERARAAVTSVPAHHFGLTDRGRIAPGLHADLLLVDGDPTQDITATRSIVEVWRHGTRHVRSHDCTRPTGPTAFQVL